MTRVIFIRKDKSIKVESTNKTFKLWEESDGFHSFSSDAIFSHHEGLYSPILIFFEDIVSPVGSSRSVENVNSIAAITDLIKDGGGKTSISKMFSRWLGHIEKYFLAICILGIVIYGLVVGYLG